MNAAMKSTLAGGRNKQAYHDPKPLRWPPPAEQPNCGRMAYNGGLGKPSYTLQTLTKTEATVLVYDMGHPPDSSSNSSSKSNDSTLG